LALIWFLPNVAAVISSALTGEWAIAVVAFVTLLCFVGILWAINALAGLNRKDKEPAP
jgi:hypothetical protein